MPDRDHLRLGRLAAAEDIPVSLHATRLVVRHAAIVGSTGSGKTSAVASLLQSFVRGGWSSAHILVIDPHGEYSRALEEFASVRSVLGADTKQLRVPYWALPAREILRIFTASMPGATAANRFSELVGEARRKFVEAAEWISLDPSAITPDTPIPFGIRPIWRQMDRENRETRTIAGDPASARVIDEGDEATLRPTQFEPYGPAGRPPNKGPLYGAHGTTPDLLRLGLLDPRLRFFQEPVGDAAGPDPLVQVMVEWLGGGRPVSVLDFSGVSAEAADVAIGVVLNLVFEVALRTQSGDTGIGRPSPVMVVLEEAHRYLGGEATALTRESANRIAREGRKYGVGLLMVSQRPTELPKTALAQCGTIVALRLSNSEDQGAIRAALPDSVAGLAAVLPSLRTGEAIVSGEAAVIPCRCLIDQPDPRPLAEDPSLASWRSADYVMDLAPSIKAWRGTYQGET
ncbi:MAG TPA: helicase HerA-like domain-containing protein [Candidatus Dormibacteraeota bacterium]|nr:helicase HerA-like domain-containing protein [Candidatus Dormibacteraeota bacterium]